MQKSPMIQKFRQVIHPRARKSKKGDDGHASLSQFEDTALGVGGMFSISGRS